MALIKCEDVSIGYEGQTVVRDLNFQIDSGDYLCIVGENGSGKSTLAVALERRLSARGILCRILDGDNVRCGINAGLGFSEEDRRENIRRVAEVCRLFVDTGIVVLACFVSPTRELRRMAGRIIGAEDFFEVYVATPLAECERRDVKGLYAKARRGEIRDFTGISAPFEEPEAPTLRLDTSDRTVDACVDEILQCLLPAIELNRKNEQQ